MKCFKIGITIFHRFEIRERLVKVNRPILPILTLQLVAMATSLERSDKEGMINNLRQNISMR